MRSIGIPVADRHECVIALDAAFTLGKRLGADVVGYHVRPQHSETPAVNLSEAWSGAGPAYAEWYFQDEATIRADEENAEKLFQRLADKHGYSLASRHGTAESPHAVFHKTAGTPEKMFCAYASLNDLLVVSRPGGRGGAKAFLIMMSALMDSATPVLLLPQKKVNLEGRRLALAWNRGRAEGMLAHALLPLLKQAEDVVLITVGHERKAGPGAPEMVDYLKGHGVSAREKRIDAEGRTGKALVDAARAEQAEALLCGAYTRGRMRELVFGGVTEYLLSDSDFPVVMLHI